MIFEGLGTEYAVVEFSEAGNATFDQLLDQLMENKKGLAQGVLQGDEFLKPQDNEDDSGLQVFSALESSVNAGRSTV